ncbi:hypothetical protein P4O66_005272, partial [Electrophorus voltai]
QRRVLLEDLGRAMSVVQGWTLRSLTDPRLTTKTGTMKSNTLSWTLQGPTTLPWTTTRATSIKRIGEYSDVSLWSDSEFDHGRLRSRISMRPIGACGEVSSSDEYTLSVKARSPRAQAPKSKPCKGKKAVSPLPAPEMGQSAEAFPEARAPKPEQPPPHTLGREDPVQPRRIQTQLTGGLAGAPATFPELFNSHLYNPVFVPVPIPVLITVPVALSPFMSVPVPISVSIPVSVVVLVFPPAVLLMPARIGSLSPLALPFGVSFRAVAR